MWLLKSTDGDEGLSGLWCRTGQRVLDVLAATPFLAYLLNQDRSPGSCQSRHSSCQWLAFNLRHSIHIQCSPTGLALVARRSSPRRSQRRMSDLALRPGSFCKSHPHLCSEIRHAKSKFATAASAMTRVYRSAVIGNVTLSEQAQLLLAEEEDMGCGSWWVMMVGGPWWAMVGFLAIRHPHPSCSSGFEDSRGFHD